MSPLSAVGRFLRPLSWRPTLTGLLDPVTEDAGGTAQAHVCAHGRRRWTPGQDMSDPNGAAPGAVTAVAPPGPGTGDRTRGKLAGILRRLSVKLALIATGTCDHRHSEPKYTRAARSST